MDGDKGDEVLNYSEYCDDRLMVRFALRHKEEYCRRQTEKGRHRVDVGVRRDRAGKEGTDVRVERWMWS